MHLWTFAGLSRTVFADLGGIHAKSIFIWDGHNPQFAGDSRSEISEGTVPFAIGDRGKWISRFQCDDEKGIAIGLDACWH